MLDLDEADDSEEVEGLRRGGVRARGRVRERGNGSGGEGVGAR